MKYFKLNSYTRILNDGKHSLQEKERLVTEQSLSKSKNYLKEKKNRRPADQNKIYTKFVNEMFEDRDFIAVKEFNRLIKDRFNSSTTYYRDRMEKIGLIIVANRLVRKKKNEPISEESEKE
ncbi:hypothetical protein [Chryseobacterium flavum]|uniref:hypothetical protein n=1 Tax=Chryseobacterium flavum TaxID=415851 RepID=UPI0028A9E415|nr:hypothetical protein [Chryseobacterium flavum]